jgi:glycosyltransferase involved in cell wall biosynthesis
MLVKLVRGLEDRGVKNVVVSLSKREALAEQFEEWNVPVVSLAMRQGTPDPRGMLRLRRVLAEHNPDILQGWMYHGNLMLSLSQLLTHRATPLVWNIRRGLDDMRERRLVTRLMVAASARVSRSATKIIYCTDTSAAQHERHGFAPEKRAVIGNGFDNRTFYFRPSARAYLLAELGIPNDALLIGNVGRYDIAKGQAFLVDAFAGALFSFPTAHLILAGRGMDLSNRALCSLISRRGLCSRVHLVGERSPVEELYPAFDVYCSSSISEGFPNVIAEAMASGVACVVTDTGASRQLVEGLGLVVQVRSVEHLTQALLAMLSKTPEERRENGRLLHDRIATKYSIANVVASYASLYGGLLGRDTELSRAA